MALIQVGRNVSSEEAVDFESLFLSHEGDDSETRPVSEFVLLIFRLFERGSRERSGDFGLLTVDFTVPSRALNAVGDRVWFQNNAAGIPQEA